MPREQGILQAAKLHTEEKRKKRMKTFIIAGTLLISALVYVKSRSMRSNGGEIQGRWEIVEWPEGWKKVPGTHVTITPGEVKIVAGIIPAATLHYTADQEAGTIDTTRTSNGKSVEQHGLYQRDGDTLTILVGAEGKERPASLDATGSGADRWVLRKKEGPVL